MVILDFPNGKLGMLTVYSILQLTAIYLIKLIIF